MTDQPGPGQPEEGAAGAPQQPGVSDSDLGEEPERAKPEDLEIVDAFDVAEPPVQGDQEEPRVNADLVDDPAEVLRTIQEATGETVEGVSEDKTEA